LWEFKLQLPESAKMFLTEARSDALTSIPLVLLGFRKQAALAIRQVLEDVLRHVYFSKHEVEFGWLKREKYFMPWSELLDYLTRSLFYHQRKLEKRVGLTLKRLYSDLSKFVHVKSPDYAQPSSSLRQIKFNREFFEYYCAQTSESMNCCNATLLLFRWDDFLAFDLETRRTIKQSISPDLYTMVTTA